MRKDSVRHARQTDRQRQKQIKQDYFIVRPPVHNNKTEQRQTDTDRHRQTDIERQRQTDRQTER